MLGRCLIAMSLAIVLTSCRTVGVQEDKGLTPLGPNASGAWELKVLGVDDDVKLAALRSLPKRRRVKLAVVGQGGIGRKRLAKFFTQGNTITFHGCADQNKTTHDTGQVEVTLDMTAALGVPVDLHVWQPGESFDDVARCMREAGETCDVVSFFQSFWGPKAQAITDAIGQSPGALFVSPYGEYHQRPTIEAPQGGACKPWVEKSIGHFILAAPLARRKSKGDILTPFDRGPSDTEAVNFIAPSHHANGTGGTCPAAATTSGVAACLYAVMAEKPSPQRVVALMRDTVKIDRKTITSVPEFDDESVDRLAKKIGALRYPPEGKTRKLDAPGVLNLYDAVMKSLERRRWW